MRVALALAKIVNDAVKLADTDLLPSVHPVVELRHDARARASERTDFGVESDLVVPVRVVVSAPRRISD